MNSQNDSQNTLHLFNDDPPEKRGRSSKLNSLSRSTYQKFLKFIEVGAYDHVAAASLGIHPVTFYSWMARGEKAKTGKYRQFYLDVVEARGKARLIAETKVFNQDPKYWLSRGPGRTRPGLPGWTDHTVQLEVSGSAEVNHTGEIRHSLISPGILAAALCELDELGLLTSTCQILEARSEPVEEGENDDGTKTMDEDQPSYRGSNKEGGGNGEET